MKTSLLFVLVFTLCSFSSLVFSQEDFFKQNLKEYDANTAKNWVRKKCPMKDGKEQCRKLTIIVFSDTYKDDSFARAGYRAAKALHKNGIEVAYIMSSDIDSDSSDATMIPYMYGHQDDCTEYKIKSIRGVLDKKFIDKNNVAQEIYNSAYKCYEKAYELKTWTIPNKKPSLLEQLFK
ncbi:hypothetical protein JEU11_06650 [Paraglaciecola chathamensis]|uniref:VWFA domain-containing protein n=1 Tax=Paraglaciecola chathamensis TaxID=368405 RepID=A0ABS0WCF3_9ALTE|nr:hypothetical protein [Paraglaciecola chathamensis]MBJ2136126.1 hypothetical protein [Paraglaciecola chathamensis]